MLTIEERISSFIRFGRKISLLLSTHDHALADVMQQAFAANAWFTIENQQYALDRIASMLEEDAIRNWAASYDIPQRTHPFKVGVVMAGNIPLVNFHDFLSVLITGHVFVGKLSTTDAILLPFMAKLLVEDDNRWADFVLFTDAKLSNMDAVIATGSDNTSRYFEYYFSKYPHIIRRNRTSVGFLTSSETTESIALIGNDVFRYFGLGCRNVSKIYVPDSYDITQLFEAFSCHQYIINHHKYHNNYDYQKAINLINKFPFYDSGWMLMKYSDDLFSPVSMLYIESYNDTNELISKILSVADKIQCVVGEGQLEGISVIRPGESQSPSLTDYPDGVDVVQFLLNL